MSRSKEWKENTGYQGKVCSETPGENVAKTLDWRQAAQSYTVSGCRVDGPLEGIV